MQRSVGEALVDLPFEPIQWPPEGQVTEVHAIDGSHDQIYGSQRPCPRSGPLRS
jgi:hypothetical protein